MSIATDGTAPDRAAIAEQLGDAATVLLLAPTLDDAAKDACAGLLGVPDTHDRVLCVTFTEPAADRLSTWEERGVVPETVGIVSVEGMDAPADDRPAEDGDPEVSVAPVASPGDLTGLGIALSRYVEEWTGDGPAPVICFHSLTTMLQYADLRAVFRFLHVLGRELSETGAVVHYHMDPGAHEESDVNVLLSLFDAVVRVEDGGWTVNTRPT